MLINAGDINENLIYLVNGKLSI